MRNYFTLGGVDSRHYGVYISGQGTFESSARALNMLSVPGRNGDLIGAENRLENRELTYPAFIYANFRENIRNFRALLLSDAGYRKLMDSYHPDEYRLAVYRGPFEPDVTGRRDAGQFDVTFIVKPQRFLLSGETVTTLKASGEIENPTLFPSQPLLRVYGTGILGIGSHSITITKADTYTDIDCEMQDAYKGAVSKNRYIQLSDYNFPTLAPGTNRISLGTGISRIEITPRWWTV